MKKLQMLDFEWEYGTQKLSVTVSSYADNKRLYISLVNKRGEPFSDVTINLPFEPAKINEAYISNDCSELISFISQHNLGELLEEEGYSGFSTYAKVAFDLKRLGELDPEGIKKFCLINKIII